MDLDESYRHCCQIARRAASSFYWSFWLLPREKRRSMCALYAFSRKADDLSDSDLPVDTRRRQLQQWRETFTMALAGTFDDPVMPALADTVQRFEIPQQYLVDVIDGVEMDLQPRRYETFDELSEYCRRVASAVGLACIHIWGYDNEAALGPAVKCGLAFQLTNILRDLKEDADRGRLYLPLEDLRRFEVPVDDLLAGVCDDRYRHLIDFEIARAEQLYRGSAALVDHLGRDGRTSARLDDRHLLASAAENQRVPRRCLQPSHSSRHRRQNGGRRFAIRPPNSLAACE